MRKANELEKALLSLDRLAVKKIITDPFDIIISLLNNHMYLFEFIASW